MGGGKSLPGFRNQPFSVSEIRESGIFLPRIRERELFRGPRFFHFCSGNPGIEDISFENPRNKTIPGSGIFLFSYENLRFGFYIYTFIPIVLMIWRLLLSHYHVFECCCKGSWSEWVITHLLNAWNRPTQTETFFIIINLLIESSNVYLLIASCTNNCSLSCPHVVCVWLSLWCDEEQQFCMFWISCRWGVVE